MCGEPVLTAVTETAASTSTRRTRTAAIGALGALGIAAGAVFGVSAATGSTATAWAVVAPATTAAPVTPAAGPADWTGGAAPRPNGSAPIRKGGPAHAGRLSSGHGHHGAGLSVEQGDGAAAEQDLGEVMGHIARLIQQEHGDVEKTLQAITKAAVDAVPGAEAVSISLVRGKTVQPRAATDDLPKEIDDLQSRLEEGPCLSALREDMTVRVDDYDHEDRWPRFVAEARKQGVGSSLSFQLFVEADSLGALNLYSRAAHAFDDDSESIGLVFASHASIALSAAQQEQNLRRAIDKRDLIGQAKGILMERYKLTAEQAFQLLARTSSHTNRKLFDVADELTSTGAMPPT